MDNPCSEIQDSGLLPRLPDRSDGRSMAEDAESFLIDAMIVYLRNKGWKIVRFLENDDA